MSGNPQSFIADACALLAYLQNEDGAQEIDELLANASNTVYAHAINLCEIYYGTARAKGNAIARSALEQLNQDGVVFRDDMDEAFWIDAALLKINPGQLSIADCFAVALARRENCELLTADHHEMDKLVGTGIVAIRFIR